jgi:hypothetical protein
MNREQYDALEAENFSTLKELARSPAHYKAAKLLQREATDAMDIGTAFHLLSLEPEREEERLAIWDEGTRRGKAWESFCEKHAGKTILKRDDYETAKAMSLSVRSSPMAKPYLVGGKAEVTLQWEEQGFKCKGRVDYLSHAIVDLKSTRSAAVVAFGKQMFDALVHAQLAFYRSGVKATGAILPCVLIATENTFPYVTQVYRLTEAQLEQGASEYSAWLATLKHCNATQTFPGYWPEETDLQFPKWAQPEEIYQ